MTQSGYRIEHDSMGEFEVPNDAYYGASTCRAIENFPISSLRFGRSFIKALGLIKLCGAETNNELGLIDENIAAAMKTAAQEVVEGKLDEHFHVDIFQTGSGTSTNMNANEVIANRAIEIMGGVIGSKSPVHPNDHVNRGQSSNDVIPSAIHIALALSIRDELLPAMAALARQLDAKSKEFWDVIKTGRTHLQDATPIRLGQEFKGYADQVQFCHKNLQENLPVLALLALGGTAVGTGIGTHKRFAELVTAKLSKITEFPFKETNSHFKSQATVDPVVLVSGLLKTYSVSLMKIANDIRWLGSGPRAGFGEIDLPEVQPGSSIMPGKVNPVIAESVAMVCAQVVGNDSVVAIAGMSGNFELNVMLPVAYYNTDLSVQILSTATRNFNERCIKSLKATSAGPDAVERGLSLATALAPTIGYDQAAALAKEAAATGQTIREIAKQKAILPEDELTKLLNPFNMTEPSE